MLSTKTPYFVDKVASFPFLSTKPPFHVHKKTPSCTQLAICFRRVHPLLGDYRSLPSAVPGVAALRLSSKVSEPDDATLKYLALYVQEGALIREIWPYVSISKPSSTLILNKMPGAYLRVFQGVDCVL